MYETKFGIFKVRDDAQVELIEKRLEDLVNVHGWTIIQRDYMFYEQGDTGGFVYGIWMERWSADAGTDELAVELEQAVPKRGRPAKVDA